jgi:hypothetical protein
MTTKVQLVSNIVGNVSGGASFTGIVTASSFSGDGSLLTGVGGGVGQPTGDADGLFNYVAAAATITQSITFDTLNAGNFNSYVVSVVPNITVASGVGVTVSGSGANLTGISSVSFATTSFGLSGNPIISVSGVNNTGVSTLTDTRLSSIADKTTIVSGNSASLVYNTGGGNVAICTNPSGPITLNVTGIPTDSSFDNRAISFAVIVNQGTTAYGCTDVSLNGVVFWCKCNC